MCITSDFEECQMGVYQVKETGKWRVQIGSKNNRVTKVFSTKREADRFLALHDVKREGIDVTTWNDLADDYLNSPKFRDKSEKTKPVEVRASKPLLAALGKMLVVETDDRIVEKYKDTRLMTVSDRTKKFLSGNTVRLELSFLAILVKIALRNRIIKISPCALVEKPKCNEREVRISPSDAAVMWATLSKMEFEEPETTISYRYFWCLYHLGCRPSELAELTYSNVNVETKQIRFRRTKNTKSRTVPVVSNCWGELESWILRDDKPPKDECPFVFPHLKRSGEYAPFDFSNAWKKLKKRCGNLIDPAISPHAFRHERISYWFESTDMNEGQIMELSGHLTPVSLNRYRHIRAERFRGKLESLVANEHSSMVDAFGKTYANGFPTERKAPEKGWGAGG